MGRHRIHATARSEASRDAVWAVLADVDRWSEWGPWKETSFEREGTPRGGAGAIRLLRMPGMTLREEILEADPPAHLAYTVLSGLPVRDYRADVQLTDGVGGGTQIDWRAEFDGSFPGAGVAMRLLIGRALRDASKRVARAAEQRA